MNEESNYNTDTLRCAVRLCAVGRAKCGGRDNDFIIRDDISGKRKAVRERHHCGKQVHDNKKNNADFGGDNYRSECRDNDAHSAHVSDETDESENYAANRKRACVGAV